jgi:hypothetical protein
MASSTVYYLLTRPSRLIVDNLDHPPRRNGGKDNPTMNENNNEKKTSGLEPLPDRWFYNKRYVPLIATRKACKINFQQRYIYSYLVFRLSKEQGATKRRIASVLGIDRGEAVPNALNALQKEAEGRCKLVEEGEGEFWALEPTGDAGEWFAKNRRTDESWHRQFSTYKVFMPTKESKLTTKTNGLLWLLYSLAPRWKRPVVTNQTKKGLAVLLGVSQKCVDSALDTLGKHELVRIDGNDYELLPPKEECLTWWKDRPKKKPQKKNNAFLLSEALGWTHRKKPEEMAQLNRILDTLLSRSGINKSAKKPGRE